MQTANGMQQSATLTWPQEAVIASLLSGATVSDAAKAAGVYRTTVHRWLREDFTFQAELNRLRGELRTALQDRLMRLADKAVEYVGTAVEGGDARAAMTLLRSLGILAPPAIGSADVEALRVERKVARQKLVIQDAMGGF